MTIINQKGNQGMSGLGARIARRRARNKRRGISQRRKRNLRKHILQREGV